MADYMCGGEIMLCLLFYIILLLFCLFLISLVIKEILYTMAQQISRTQNQSHYC